MPEPVPMDTFQCEGCKGRGQDGWIRPQGDGWTDVCKTCHGIGVVFRVREVKSEACEHNWLESGLGTAVCMNCGAQVDGNGKLP